MVPFVVLQVCQHTLPLPLKTPFPQVEIGPTPRYRLAERPLSTQLNRYIRVFIKQSLSNHALARGSNSNVRTRSPSESRRTAKAIFEKARGACLRIVDRVRFSLKLVFQSKPPLVQESRENKSSRFGSCRPPSERCNRGLQHVVPRLLQPGLSRPEDSIVGICCLMTGQNGVPYLQ